MIIRPVASNCFNAKEKTWRKYNRISQFCEIA